MQQYGVRDVERLLRLPRSTLRALIDAGFVTPTRGPRNAWLFSFRDLIVLRTAQALVAADVPRKRITRSVKELRRRLPESMPLSGLSICAVGGRVVVKEGARRWNADWTFAFLRRASFVRSERRRHGIGECLTAGGRRDVSSPPSRV